MLEYVILFESKHQNGSHISFGYLSVLARFAPVGGPKLGRSEFLEPLMNLVLWQEKCNAFPSDHFLMLAAEGEDYRELAQIPARFTCLFLDADVQLVYFTTF